MSHIINNAPFESDNLGRVKWHSGRNLQTRDLALASMAQDDLPASSTAAAMRGKMGSEFET